MKKVIAILLATIFVFTSLAACSKAPPSGSGTETPAPSSEPASPESEEPVTLYMLSAQSDFDKQSEQRDKVHQKIIDETGVDLQLIFTTKDKIVEKANLMLSAKEQVDIVTRYPINLAMQLYDGGALMAFTPEMLEKAPDLKGAFTDEEWAAVCKDGIYLGAPKVRSQLIPSLLQVRTDWLEKLNLPMPKTVEDFEKVLELFLTSDLDGNGKDDTIPIMSSTILELEQAVAPFVTQNSTGWWLDTDGSLKPPEMAEDYKVLLKTLQDWYQKGYLYREITTTPIENKTELVAQNSVGVFANNWTYLLYGGWEVLAQAHPEAEYVPVALEGSGSNKYLIDNPASQVNIVTSMCKHPDQALKLFDYMGSPEGFYLSVYGIEGENYTKLPSGFFEIIGEDKQDWKSAEYFILYNVFEPFPAWRELPWPMETWVYSKMNELSPQIKALPMMTAPDTYLLYDVTKFESESKINDLETYIAENKINVITGKTSVDQWDAIMEEWLKIGGNTLISDKTLQYKEAN